MKVEKYMVHGSSGFSIKREEWVNWVLEHQTNPSFNQENGYGFGSMTYYTWEVNGVLITKTSESWIFSTYVLPDQSGFITFESGWKSDNCLLLDVYGEERMRLTLPRHLMGGLVDPTYETGEGTFINVSEPYTNPVTGIEGQFGVTAYVEEGKFYFELNYHTGEFLWCRQIRD